VLLEMADAVAARDRDLARVGLFLSQDQSKESGFAVAVASDQTETLAAVHLKADVGEKLSSKIGLGKLVDPNHDSVFQ
jgi:hypothetical protein